MFRLFLINEKVYLKEKPKSALQKETGSLVCGIIPRAVSVKCLLQSRLCLIIFKIFFQIKSTAVASSDPLNSVLNRVQATNGL